MIYNLTRYSLLFALAASGLISGCVSQSDYDALAAQNRSLQQQNTALTADVSSNKAQIARLQDAIKYTVNSDMLFESGSWQMSPQGEKIIASFTQRLAPMQQSKVIVSGYTDNAPIGRSLQRQGVNSNDELSQKRAEAVMQFMIAQGMKPDMVGAQGFGEAQPIASNDTPKGRAMNCRVELALAEPSPPPAPSQGQ